MATPFTLASEAARGFSNAAQYDQYRPSYPAEAVDKLLTHLGVAGLKNARVVDLACGTGKFTELLTARPEEYEVVGVEPHREMREELVKKNLARVKVLDGDAGNMPIGEGWGDALVAAQVRRMNGLRGCVRADHVQAFHWFATEASLKEIHRVLRPGAAFGMIWNVEDCM
jgi:SAM-dependent methyltransferase